MDNVHEHRENRGTTPADGKQMNEMLITSFEDNFKRETSYCSTELSLLEVSSAVSYIVQEAIFCVMLMEVTFFRKRSWGRMLE